MDAVDVGKTFFFLCVFVSPGGVPLTKPPAAPAAPAARASASPAQPAMRVAPVPESGPGWS